MEVEVLQSGQMERRDLLLSLEGQRIPCCLQMVLEERGESSHGDPTLQGLPHPARASQEKHFPREASGDVPAAASQHTMTQSLFARGNSRGWKEGEDPVPVLDVAPLPLLLSQEIWVGFQPGKGLRSSRALWGHHVLTHRGPFGGSKGLSMLKKVFCSPPS